MTGDISRLDDILYICAISGCFHIESASHLDGDRQQTQRENNPYAPCYKRLKQLDDLYELGLSSGEPEQGKFQLKNAEKLCSRLENHLKTLSDERAALNEALTLHESTLKQLVHMQGLNVDFQRIFNAKHIRARFGKLPVDSYPKLKYYENENFFFIYYDKDDSFYWGMYFCTVHDYQYVDDVFESLYFKRIHFPDFVHGTGKDAVAQLTESIAEDKRAIAEINEKLKTVCQEYSGKLKGIYPHLKLDYSSFELRKYAAVYSDRFVVTGFVPKTDSEGFVRRLDDIEDVTIGVMPAETDDRLTPPVKLKNDRFSRPFEMFVEMYGLPGYKGFNPTLFVAITYTLLFGIMFGDFGQGLMISLIGFLVYKKSKNRLGQILMRIGVSSAFFGLIFGSCFGYEHLLDPIYPKLGLSGKPLEVMDNTLLILGMAIGIGVLIILISIIYNIVVSLKQRDYENALFGSNGVIGLVFYSALLAGLVLQLLLGKTIMTAPYVLFLIVLPLVLMFFREPLGALMKHKKPRFEGIGDFIASNFFEVFEFLLSYATNTLSFVRVGGFVLSHAGMMSVVMLLSETVSGGASILVVALGNAFVIGMEGLIVGIQVLRLEFYEIFSRCYEGGGQPYNPIRLNAD